MKVLITGAAGFIGAHLCKVSSQSGHQVTAVDNFSDYYSVEYKKARVNALVLPYIQNFETLNLRDLIDVQSFLNSNSFDLVIHLAAQAGVRLPLEKSFKYAEDNLLSFTNLLQSCGETGVDSFIYASSSSVYGNTSKTPYSEKELKLNPTSFYGSTKLSNEILAPTLGKLGGVKVRGLRFFTVYGPWGRPDMAYLRLIERSINGGIFELNGDGSVKRDFTYVDDCVSSIISLMQDLKNRENFFSDVVNIGGGNPASIQNLISNIETIVGNKIEVRQLAHSNLDVAMTMADSTYLKSLIGKIPTVPLETGLEETVKWARENKEKLTNWIWKTA